MKKTKEDILESIEAVIFDMDGTLIDSMWIWPTVDREFMGKYHLKEPENFHQIMEGKSYTESAQVFLELFPNLPCTVEEIKKEWLDMTYQKYATQVKLKEGALEFISYLRRRGIKLGIATSNARELTDAVLEALDISKCFDAVHTACEVNKGKPSPDIYLFVAGKLKVKEEKCLVFEDVPMGILAGKNAGMRVCAVEDEFSKKQEGEKKRLADFYIRDYFEIEKGDYEVLRKNEK